MILPLLAESALRSLALGAAVWLALRLLRVRNPHAQMTAWTAVLIASLSMPVLMRSVTVTLPPGPSRLATVMWASSPVSPHPARSELEAPASPFPPATSQGAASWPEPAASVSPPEAALSPEPSGSRAADLAGAADATQRSPGWSSVAAGIYLMVAGAFGLRLLTGLMLTFRLVRRARPIGESWAAGRDVRVSNAVSVPVTFGTTILLPRDHVQWSVGKRRAVLLHEGSHAAHGDFYVLLLAGVHRAVFWFNPLAWWLVVRLAEIAETISDDAAIEVLDDRPHYADVLLDIARKANGMVAGLSMARPSTVRQRIDRILSATQVAAHLGSSRRLLIAAALIPLIGMSAASLVPGTGAAAKAIMVEASRSEPFTLAAASATTEHDRSASDTELLDAYVGYYAADPKVYPDLVFTISREGHRLFAQSTGNPKLEVFAESDQMFFYGMVDAQITFAAPSRGRAAAMVLHENGMDTAATRVDAAAAERANDLFAQRFADQARSRTAIAVDAGALDRQVGYYQLNPRSIFTVSREGDSLFAQLTGQPRFQLFAESEHDFFYAAVAAQISFVSGPDGDTAALVLHQNGRNRPARRVDEQQAREAAARAAEQLKRRADQERPRVAIAIDPAQLDRHVGLYERGANSIFTITREGDQLFAQLTGQPRFPIFAESATEFFYQAIAAQITFVETGSGPASELVLHQNGRDMRAARIADVPRRDAADFKADSRILDSYVGWYELDATRALAATREGDRLFLQETRRPRFEVFAVNGENFVAGSPGVFVIFKPDRERPGAELLLQEPAQGARRAVRVDEARARLIEAAFVRQIAVAPDRFKDQLPAEGTRTALLQWIADVQHGTPSYDRMSPPLAEAVRRRLPQLHAMMSALGSVESVFFRGVGPGGYDIYGVKFARGSAEYRTRPGPGQQADDVIFHPAGDATPGGIVGCSEEQTVKPATGTAPVRLVLYNRTGTDLRVFEVNFEGQRIPYSTIGDERFGDIWTYTGRPFVIADPSGQCREIVLPGQRTRYVLVHPFRPDGQPNEPALPRMVPMPGSDDLLLRLIEAVRRGEPEYDRMTAQAAGSAHQNLVLFQAIVTKLGAVRAMSFRGVTAFDSDIYSVQFANGSAEWRIGVTAGGKISQVVLGPAF